MGYVATQLSLGSMKADLDMNATVLHTTKNDLTPKESPNFLVYGRKFVCLASMNAFPSYACSLSHPLPTPSPSH